MGYVIKKLSNKKRSWKLQYVAYVDGNRKTKDIIDDELLKIGFSPLMGHKEARTLCCALNGQHHLKRIQEKRNQINDKIKLENLKVNAYLPSVYVNEFELLFVPKDSRKLKSHWLVAKKIIVELGLDIKDWNYYKNQFYLCFERHNYGYSYVQKLIQIINKWGKFIARKQQTFFEPIEYPRGRQKERIIDNHEEIKGSFKSDPITPETLESNINNLKPEQYNWLFISIWLGLRPNEVDSLKLPESKKTWFIENLESYKIIWIYQSKLTGISSSERLKPIPLKYSEQLNCLSLKEFKRPLTKTLKKYLTPNTNLYAGRKGFVDLMLSKGNSLEAISMWLGHKNINRTWKNYKDKKKVLF